MANAGISLLLALLINNVLPGRQYPMRINPPIRPKTEPIIVPEQVDLEWALTQMDSVIDISIEDLADIYQLAQNRAKDRFDSKTK